MRRLTLDLLLTAITAVLLAQPLAVWAQGVEAAPEGSGDDQASTGAPSQKEMAEMADKALKPVPEAKSDATPEVAKAAKGTKATSLDAAIKAEVERRLSEVLGQEREEMRAEIRAALAVVLWQYVTLIRPIRARVKPICG